MFFLRKRDDIDAHFLQTNGATLPFLETPRLELKCPNWKQWAYTDGSCLEDTHNGHVRQYIGAGVYVPETEEICYVQPSGVGMTNTNMTNTNNQ